MKKHSSPLTPEQDALQHIAAPRDKPFLIERFIDSSKGRGVFTQTTIKPSTFVVEYRGKISLLGTRPERRNGDTLHGFLYKFSWSGSRWCVDAPRDDGSLGRLVNDDHISPNCIMKKIVSEGKPHLCLFAVKEISPGEEITFNYGSFSYSWRSNVEDPDKSSSHEDDEDHENLPGPSLDNGSSPNSELDSSEEMTENSKLKLDSDSFCQKKKKKSLNSDQRGLDRAHNASDKNISFTHKNYCYVCGKGYVAIRRHLLSHANEEPDIAQVFALPKDSRERKKQFEILRNRGNYKHNQEVIRNKCGSLKVRKHLRSRQSANEYTTCWYCKGMFLRENFKFHLSRCVKVTANSKPGDVSGIMSDTSDSRHLERLPSEVRNMLSSMEADVSSAIKSDVLLVQLAQILFEKYRADPSKQGFIRQNLRDMGRLRLALHKTSLVGFADALKVHSFFKVVDGVRSMAGFDKNKQNYKKPSLALNLGILLKRIAMLVITSRDSEKDMVRHATIFIKRYATEWFELVSQPAIVSLTGRKVNGPSTIPFTRDVQAFYLYLEKTSASAIESMETSECPEVYSSLCRVTLAQASVLSKCAAEVSEMSLKSFQQRDNVTQVLSKHFTRINIQNKTGQTVPVLLTSDLFRALTLLVNKRQVCGVHDANPFLFARPDGCSSSLYHARNCIREFSTLCGAKNPEHLGSESLYKHAARIFQILNLENDELEHLGKLLDHDIWTERDYYRSPEAAVELAKIAKLIQAMEKGSLEGFKGNSLEEVEIEDELEPDVDKKTGDPDAETNNEDSDPLCLRGDEEQRDVSQDNSDKANTSKKGLNDPAASSVGDRVVDLSNVDSSAEHFSDHEHIISDEELDEGVSSLGDVSSIQQDTLNSSDNSDSDGGSKKIRKCKKNYCYVCGRPQSKIGRHLFTHRKQEPEIAEAFALRRKSKERKILLKKLSNRGNEKHKEKISQLLNTHKATTPSKEQAACIYCKAMYDHKEIWQHIQKCHMKSSSTPLKQTRLTTLAADTGLPDPEQIPGDLKKMLKRLKKDEIGALVRSDPHILQLAQCMYHTVGSEKDPAYLSSKLRLLGRLLLELKKKSIHSFEEVLKPQNLPSVVEAVNQIAAQSKAISRGRTLIPFHLGSMISKIADIHYAKIVRQEAAKETIKEAETFLKLCAKEWPCKCEQPKTLCAATVSFICDTQAFYRCLVDTTSNAIHTLSLYTFPPVYTALLKVTLAHVSLLNKNAADISKITFASVKDREQTELQGEAAGCQSHLEHVLSMHSVKINVKTTDDKDVALTLTDQLLSAFSLLVNKREACGVHQSNPYFFAKPKAGPAEHYQGLSCIKFQLGRCDRKCHEGLASADFRVHIVRIFKILSLTNDGLDQLAKLLGRGIQTDSEFYQKPEAATDIAKLSELVLAMKNGSLQRFEGKSLEEIEIPDELHPIVEMDPSEEAEEDDEDLEKSLQRSKAKTTKRKRQSSSSKGKQNNKSTKKKKKETHGSEKHNEEDDESTQKEFHPEEASDKFDISALEEELVSSSKNTETHISFSDDDVDMDVDFDLDTDDNVGLDENDCGDSPAKSEVMDGEDISAELENNSEAKKEDIPADAFNSCKHPEDSMDTGNHVEEDDSVEEADEEDDCLDTNCGDSSANFTPAPEKKNNLTAVLSLMKEVKILIPKLDIEKLQNQLGDSKSSQTNNLAAPGQSLTHNKNQTETPSTQAAVTDEQSYVKVVCMTCSFCKKSMKKGQTAFQKKGFNDVFCSKNCLFGMFPQNKQAFKTCHHCQKAITQLLDLIMAAVDSKGTMKDFCSPTCLCSFKYKTVSFLMPQPLCSRCNKPCTMRKNCQLTLEETVHKFCNNACLEEFCRDQFGECEECRSTCRNKPLRLKFEDGTKTICSDECLREFTKGLMTHHQCMNCSSSHPVYQMETSRTPDNLVELFCHRSCVTSYKLQLNLPPSPEENTGQIQEKKKRTEQNRSKNIKTNSTVSQLNSAVSLIIARSCFACSKCEKELPEGDTLYQPKNSDERFCSSSCLFEKHPGLRIHFKKCYNCLQVIMRPHNIILAAVDGSGIKKELCSNTCLTSVQTRMNLASPQPRWTCSMCSKHTHCQVTFTLNNRLHRFCKDTCVINFHKLKNLPAPCCNVCASFCSDRKLLLKMEDDSKTVCSEECLFKFKEKVEARRLCHMCQTPHRMSDMVEHENEEGRLEFFCSGRCLMVYRSQSLNVPENEIVSSEENDVNDIKFPLLSLDNIKEEPIDDDYSQNPEAPPDIKNEPYLVKEEVKISSDFPSSEESSPTEPTPPSSSESCSTCQKPLMDGETIYQRKGLPDIFCSTACLSDFHQIKQRKKTCFFCLQVLTESQDVCHRSVDEDGTEKDFCSQTCLSSFNCKKTASNEILNEPFKSQCSICCRYCISKHEIMLKKIIYKVCSDPCYLRFCTINNMSICELCRRCCETPLILRMEDDKKTLCSEDCVSQFKQQIQTPQQCAMCGTSVPVSDMYENKISDDVIELFCTKGCVTASKIQAVSASGAAFNCDKCGRNSVPACHLAMADATIRNFCSLTCAVAFKKTQKDLTTVTNSTEASSQTQKDSHKPAEKLLCAHCQCVLKTLPKVIYTKEKLIFVCSTVCSQDFQRVNIIRGKCENCKSERIIKDIKKVDGRCLSFCSDGCEALSLLQLEKKCGQRLGSCSYCLSRFKTLRTVEDVGTEEEFCSEDCCSKYKLCLSHMAKCDSCGHQGKLKQSLALLGEVKHFCDVKCLLSFCCKVVREKITASELIPPTETSPVITSVVSLAEALVRRAKSSSASAQHATTETSLVVTNDMSASSEQDKSSFFDIEAEIVGHASTQTVQKELRNKSTLCTPLVHNKGVSCAAQMVATEAQTDKVDPDILVLPVPVFVPLPMNMYTQYTPTPLGLPLPLPVPVFLPVATDGATLMLKEKSKPSSGDQNLRPETETGEDNGNKREDDGNKREDDENKREDDGNKREDEPPTRQVTKGREGNLESLSRKDSPCSSPPGRLPSSTSKKRKDLHRSDEPPPVLLHKGHRTKGSKLQQTSSEETDFTVTSRKPQKLQTQWGVDAWKTWIQWRESQTNPLPVPTAVRLKEDLLHCSAEELSHGLCCFVNEVKQANGEPPPPNSLFYLCLCIQQYLFDNNRTENIFSDLIYSRFSSEFTKIMKQPEPRLTRSGYVPSCVEEEFLWECKQLGAFSPIVLLNTLLFFSCKYLGFTSVQQHRSLSFIHIRSFRRTKGNHVTTLLRFYLPNIRSEAQSDTDGVPVKKHKKNEEHDYLEMTENLENPLRCPVRLYKFYLSKCSQSVRQRSDLFYLRPDHSCVPSCPLWFSPMPLDDATMEAMLVRILAIREIQRKD